MAIDDLYLQDLLHQTIDLFDQVAPPQLSPSNNQQNSVQQINSYQAPIKGTYYNSGNFSPGVATDARHAGGHAGVDLRAPGGTTIYPITSGIVTFVGTDPKGGNVVNVQHPAGVRSYYAHLGSVSVYKGDQVSFDTPLGTIGNSGNASTTAPHLHIQTWINNNLTNPAHFFQVPAFSPMDYRIEKLWNSDADKQQAQNFNMTQYLGQINVASRADLLIKLANIYCQFNY